MSRLSNQLVATMLANKISPQPFEALVDAALREDLGAGLDATTVATIPDNQIAIAQFNARKSGVVAGIFAAAGRGATLMMMIKITHDTCQARNGTTCNGN